MKNNVNYNSSNIDLSKYINTNVKNGISESEAIQRQKIFGLNEIKKEKQKNFFQLFLSQFLELMSLLLFISGIIAIALSIYEHIEILKDEDIIGLPTTIVLNYIQGSVLIFIVIINAFFGALQEKKSNNSIEALQKMTSLKSKVIRDGQVQLIDSSEITIGDIIVVEAGDVIPADAIVLESSNLKVVESILTGESLPIEKFATNNLNLDNLSTPIGERINEIFCNCNVVNGRALAIVTKIGLNTEIGKIASLLKTKDKMMTPLQYKLYRLGKVIGLLGIILTILSFLFALLVLEDVFTNKISALTPSIILAISIAAAAIPEGLNAVINIILAVGVNKMAKKNGLVKKLTAVETLGSTAVICSDKTGTLTMNKMTIKKIWVPKSKQENIDEIKDLSKDEFNLLRYATLCTDCVINEDSDNQERIGDPTELAIVDLAINRGYSDIEWDQKYKRLADIPFDSDRKLMTTINKIDSKIYVIVKGAPDVLLSRCKDSSSLIKEAKIINNKWSDNANRVLAVAVKEIKSVPKDLDPNKVEKDLSFVGLIGMIDPPREEVKQSILECIGAGIKPVMITGDHLNTAVAIAKDLNIYHDGDLAITGVELDKLSDDELFNNIEKYSVYARVSPENKIRIVKAWQYRDQVVSMTGDGVNDAPALQAADIGCAMGITGTDVSKGAADMVLTDDNFATIVESVKLGRSIYENIRRIILMLLSSNITGIFTIVLGIFIMFFAFSPEYGAWGALTLSEVKSWGLVGLNETQLQELVNSINDNIKFESTISAILILINNLVVETIPGIALGLQDTSYNLMNKRPRSKFESVFAGGLIKRIISLGILIGVFSLLSFVLGAYVAIATGVPGLRFFYGSIAAFLVYSFGGMVKSIWLSTSRQIFLAKWSEVKYIYLSSIGCLLIVIMIVLIPQVASLFGERPEIEYFSWSKDLRQLIINNSDNLNILNANLFGNEGNSSMVDGYIWLIGFSIFFLEIIILEIYKFLKNKFSKERKQEPITEFKIIEKPIPWYQSNKVINSLLNLFGKSK